MNKLAVLLVFYSLSAFSVTIDISFSTNSWTLGTGVSQSGSEITIEGSSSQYRTAKLVKTVDPTIKNLYFIAEVYMSNISGGPESYKWPKFKVYNNSNGSNILAYNLDENIEGKWVTTGMVIENFNKKNVNQIELEFGVQNCTGTMKIRNAQLMDTPPSSTYEFPFAVPSDPSVTMDLKSTETHEFENNLLSSNSHFSWASSSWQDQITVDLINNYFPMTAMRFPGGTVGNFYNYKTDGYYGDAYTFANASRENAFNNGYTFGYDGYKSLCLANSASSVLMFNVIKDHVDTSANRLASRLNDGLDVKWIEMGNENYFSGQNYGNVTSTANYISHTTNLASALKSVDPTVQVAVNIDHDNYSVGSWNDELSKLNYFDAAVMHPYVNTNTFMLNDFSANVIFSSFKTATHRISTFNNHFPNTPLLFTEWSILSTGTPVNFVQTLGIADMFIAIEKGNQDGIVQQAGIHMLYHSDAYNEATLAYNNGSGMVLTANGIAYAELFNVFKNNTVFDAISSSEELTSDLPGVNAKAVLDGDSIRFFVVNKLPVVAPLKIIYDGTTILQAYSMKSFHEDLKTSLTQPYSSQVVAWDYNKGAGEPQIPAYSISVVSIKNPSLITNSENLSQSIFKVYPTLVERKVYFSEEIKTVQVLSIIGSKVFEDKSKSEIDLSHLSTGEYILHVVKEDGNQEIIKISKK